jgi:hypothetical protein
MYKMSGRYYSIGANQSLGGNLTPTPGLGSYSRTAAAILCGNPRVKIASNGRIYSWYAARGQGEEYKRRMLLSLGPIPTYRYRTRSLFALGV